MASRLPLTAEQIAAAFLQALKAQIESGVNKIRLKLGIFSDKIGPRIGRLVPNTQEKINTAKERWYEIFIKKRDAKLTTLHLKKILETYKIDMFVVKQYLD
jgi:hypothetical protein